MDLGVEDKLIVNILLYNDDDLAGYIGISFITEDVELNITVNNDTDELVFKTRRIRVNDPIFQIPIKKEIDFVSKVVGRIIGSYWVAKNHKGYLDLFALGIDDVMPNVIISCAASQLQIRDTIVVL